MVEPAALTKKLIVDRIRRGESFAGIDLRGFELACVCFDGVDLSRAKLAGCNLAKSTFRGADLTQASLWRTDLKECCFDGAILEQTDMDLSDLEGATFRGALVRKAIFPQGRVDWAEIDQSVRTGRRVVMQRRRSG